MSDYIKCPRDNCSNLAVIDGVFGVLPCLACQKKDEQFRVHKSPEFSSLGRMSRIVRQRDKYARDLLQPFDRNKPNPEFCRAYPGLAEQYFRRSELKGI